jgi:hypothetical protein
VHEGDALGTQVLDDVLGRERARLVVAGLGPEREPQAPLGDLRVGRLCGDKGDARHLVDLRGWDGGDRAVVSEHRRDLLAHQLPRRRRGLPAVAVIVDGGDRHLLAQ